MHQGIVQGDPPKAGERECLQGTVECVISDSLKKFEEIKQV